MSSKSYLTAPVVFVIGVLALLATWLVMEPAALHHAFDQDGYSPFELATVPFYAIIVPLVWWKCPFTGSRARRTLLCAAVSCVALMAVVKELDLHVMAMHGLFPEVVKPDGSVYGLVKPNGEALAGTPFKMRFLTNGGAPLGAKALVLAYFALFFGVFGVTLAYFAKDLVMGFFRKVPPAWSMCCFGAAGVMVQLCDRMPAWVRHIRHLPKPSGDEVDAVSSLFTALEEGGEMLIAIFAIIAILQAHRLYAKNGQ
jgi:hypothetical protein